MKKCSYCGKVQEDGNLFCTECGKPIPQGRMCPHCGANINEGDAFCSECGKRIDENLPVTTSEPIKSRCPHCGAPMNEGDVFCSECGKKVDDIPSTETETTTTQQKCPHCGASMNESDVFCAECGKKKKEVQAENTAEEITTKECLNCDKSVNDTLVENAKELSHTEEKEEEPQYNYVDEEETKTLRDYRLYIFGGLFIVLFLGICWWYWDSYNQRVAREKAVADSLEIVRQDSLEQVRQDSLLLVAQKEKEEREAKRYEEFMEKLTFANVVSLLNNFDNVECAEKCGLSLIYREVTQEEFGECIEVVYGYDIEKGNKKEYGYELIAKSNHSCYFVYYLNTSSCGQLTFINADDANLLFERAKQYGLIIVAKDNYTTYFIPNKRLPNGQSIKLEEPDYEKICGSISSPYNQDGWYVIILGQDG